MAAQSKKSNKPSPPKKTSTSKKTTLKKAPAKKKPKKKVVNSSSLSKNMFLLFGLLFIVSLASFAYFLGQKESSKPVVHTKVAKQQSTKKSKPKTTKEVKKTEVKKPHKKAVKKASIKKASVKKVDKVTYVPFSNTRAKLVIIIDDVHTRAQIDAIKALHMKITPSIFPPYKLSPNSHLLAQGLEHYMIHLPMESGNKQFNTQYKTLKVSFSNKKIENRIKELRLLFPKAKFINNHTGSVFTSDYSSMHLAYRIMRENGFIFLDSKTKNTSKVKEIANSYGDVYVARDIFIDNTHTVVAIHEQLKKAVKIAKRKGYAIAIGHPHKVTMQALASAEEILKGVELVYIDELYR